MYQTIKRSKRERAGAFVANVITSCTTQEHCNAARQLIDNFVRLYPTHSLPLISWISAKEIQITHS